MTPDQLQRIFAEASPDFSAEICASAQLDDLDPIAVDVLRQLWQRKSPDQDISTRPVEQLLADAELLVDGEVTYAALILLGTRKALGKCGLVERAGQGFDRIFRECIQQSKPLPDFAHTDAHSVWLTLHGDIQDPEFLRFLEEIGREQVAAFGLDDLLVVDLVHREQPVADDLKPRIEHLLKQGIIERTGRGRGVRLLLSRQFYRHIGKAGVYTRKRGLDRETNKELLLKHIQDNRKEGSPLRELVQVLPALSYIQVQKLLQELRIKGQIHKIGNTSAARWYPGEPPSELMPKQ